MIENETKIIEGVGLLSVMAIASNYLVEALQDMVIWLICMFYDCICHLNSVQKLLK